MTEQRLFDLVRYQRQELLTAGLISEDEYDELAKDHAAVARLESYDDVRERLKVSRINVDNWKTRAIEAEGTVERLRAALTGIKLSCEVTS